MVLIALSLCNHEDCFSNCGPVYLLHRRRCSELSRHMLGECYHVRLLQLQNWEQDEALLSVKTCHLHLQADPVHQWLRWWSRGSLWQLRRRSERLQDGKLEALKKDDRLSECLMLERLQELGINIQRTKILQGLHRELPLGPRVDIR